MPNRYSCLRMPFIRSANAFSAQWSATVMLTVSPRTPNAWMYSWQQYWLP